MQECLIKIKTPPKNHIAIMRKSWGLTEKILSGEKTIESRWYEHKHEPWDNICEGDLVFFKNSGVPVTGRATVSRVIQFENLTSDKTAQIIDQHGDEICLIDRNPNSSFYTNKKYCVLIFLSSVKKITPFKINKSGFGTMSAWLVVDDIEKIKIPIDRKIVQKKMFR